VKATKAPEGTAGAALAEWLAAFSVFGLDRLSRIGAWGLYCGRPIMAA
jgi:hypothetical protein